MKFGTVQVDLKGQNVPQFDWRKPEGKAELIKDAYGDAVPDTVFYCLDPETSLPEGSDAVYNQLYQEKPKDHASVQIHLANRQDGVFAVLRVRKATSAPLELMLGSLACPLVQVGGEEYSPDGKDCLNFLLAFSKEIPTQKYVLTTVGDPSLPAASPTA